ncbi:MAG: hypothetical protein BEU05_01900 [Marine Group III euryarchaeote CG-Bathy2]|uniref:Polar amino acid ABC transporter, inner membrane subunit (AapQ, bztB) n=2 Tax=Methanobacteriati TaxID=3366610 RepID=A0A075I1H4_9EURY|nr:polar amino acid ABC transporter, inner membrane subunit (aapQ, bztB) [uncultured marine group II/III euryarchaeote KM3_91_D09]OIR10280.1 MAG: hypothetical protein BEU05_01900 [Marine Group III euryarchaeote CG-Bathy2]
MELKLVIQGELKSVASYLRKLSPVWIFIYVIAFYCLWLYLLKFFGLSVDYVVIISRSIVIDGIEMNTSYYPVSTTVKYTGAVILACFILIQNEIKHILNLGKFFSLLADTLKAINLPQVSYGICAVLALYDVLLAQSVLVEYLGYGTALSAFGMALTAQSGYLMNVANAWWDGCQSWYRAWCDWENYIITLLGIGVYLIVLLLIEATDLSPRSQLPFLIIGGAIMIGILLFLNQTKPLLLLLVDSLRNPAGAVRLWHGSWTSVAATPVLIVLFFVLLTNLPFLPDISQNLAKFFSATVLFFVIFMLVLLSWEDSNPALTAHRTTVMVFLMVLPAILFVILRVMILVKTDARWEINFDFMDDIGGFPINNWPNQLTPTEDSRWLFYKAAVINSARATLASIFFCTIIGVIVGVTRLSSNKLAAKLATSYVEIFRNVPLAILLFIVISQMDQSLPLFKDEMNYWGMFYFSNQGIWIPAIAPSRLLLAIVLLLGVKAYTIYADWEGVADSDKAIRRRMLVWTCAIAVCFVLILSGHINYPNYIKPDLIASGSWRIEDGTGFKISTAFIALVVGLSLYTSTFVAEIVRGSIQSLPRGQVDAAISLGLTPFQRLRLVILPQALRSMIPLLNNQYMNVWKNSSLAIVVAFSDIFYVSLVMMNNVGKLIPIFTLLLITYQVGSLMISSLMNAYNSRVTRVKI